MIAQDLKCVDRRQNHEKKKMARPWEMMSSYFSAHAQYCQRKMVPILEEVPVLHCYVNALLDVVEAYLTTSMPKR